MINAEKSEMKNLKNLITKYKTKPSKINNPPIKILTNRSIPIQIMKKNSYSSNNDTQLKSNREKDSNYYELNNFYSQRTKSELNPDKVDKSQIKQKFQTTTNLIKRNSAINDNSVQKTIEKPKTSFIGIENSYLTSSNYLNSSKRLSKIIPIKNETSNISMNDKSQQSVSIKNNNTYTNSNMNGNLTTNLNASKQNYSTNPINVKKRIYNMKQIPFPGDYFNPDIFFSNPINIKTINNFENGIDSNEKYISPAKSTSTNLKSDQGLTTTRMKEDNYAISPVNIMAYLKNTRNLRHKSEVISDVSIKTQKEVSKYTKQEKESKFKDCNNQTSNSIISIGMGMDERGYMGEFVTASNERTNDQMLNINISPIIRRKQNPKALQKIKIDKITPHVISKIIEFTQYDITPIFKTCRALNTLIKEEFRKISERIIKDFQAIYVNSFEIVRKSLIFEENKSNKLSVNLLIQAKLKLPENMCGNNLTISDVVKYIGDKYFYKNMYKFDFKSSDSPSTTWIMGENSKLQSDDFNTAFVQPILSFANNDVFNISVTLLSPRGMIDESSHKWQKLVIAPIPKIDFFNFKEGHRYREIADLNLSRFCELELTKNKWIDVALTKDETVIQYAKNIQNLLFPMFSVNKMQYDDLGIFYFKIYAMAIKAGDYKADSQISINLAVKENNQNVKNEIKKNGLIFDRSNFLELRIGDVIVFFFSVSKGFLHSY